MSKNGNRNQKRNQRRRILVQIRSRCSKNVFSLERPKPLAVGARERLEALFPELQRWKINLFLGWWCRRPRYLRALARAGNYRYHPSGRRGKPVTIQDKRHARRLLDEMKTKTAGTEK